MTLETSEKYVLTKINTKTQQLNVISWNQLQINRLNDIGVAVLQKAHEQWNDTYDSVAFCLTNHNHKNQPICARVDGWSPKTELDKDGGMFAAKEGGQEFRGQPGTVVLEAAKQMIISRNIDVLPGSSGAPLMLVDENTMDKISEEDVNSRDRTKNRRMRAGDYLTLSAVFPPHPPPPPNQSNPF